MSDEARTDRLAEALERALSDPRAPLPSGDAELAELVQIARDLRDLPSPSFKARLGADLARRTAMTPTTIETTTSRGIRSVTPYLAVRPAVELIEFVKRAFAPQGPPRRGPDRRPASHDGRRAGLGRHAAAHRASSIRAGRGPGLSGRARGRRRLAPRPRRQAVRRPRRERQGSGGQSLVHRDAPDRP